jgi:hypothetical protein
MQTKAVKKPGAIDFADHAEQGERKQWETDGEEGFVQETLGILQGNMVDKFC